MREVKVHYAFNFSIGIRPIKMCASNLDVGPGLGPRFMHLPHDVGPICVQAIYPHPIMMLTNVPWVQFTKQIHWRPEGVFNYDYTATIVTKVSINFSVTHSSRFYLV